MSIYLIATLDTKGVEAQFLREQIQSRGHQVRVIDVGCMGIPQGSSDVNRDEIYSLGGGNLQDLIAAGDRGAAIRVAAKGVETWMLERERHIQESEHQVEGIVSIGGSAGTTIGTAAMRALPLGIPKLMVSTMASGQVRPYIGDKDVMMLNSVADIAGINRISRLILSNAAGAIAGMVEQRRLEVQEANNEKPLVVASMFGVTTPCIEQARKTLAEAGYETIVFHATGTGGQAMESLIREGLITGVLDITTTELADELVGGVLSAGPTRLTAAAEKQVPQVVSVGATDMVNFGPKDSVPTEFQNRKLYEHNATVTLMRTTPEECEAIGKDIASKLKSAGEDAVVLLPEQGVSAIDRDGQPFDDPVARERLFSQIESGLEGKVQVERLPNHINDLEFATAAANRLIRMMAVIDPRR